mgnify:FL=1
MSNTNHDFLVKNGLVVGQAITSTGTLTQAGQTFPASDGSAGQYLKTNGSGALSWGTVNTSFNITDGNGIQTLDKIELALTGREEYSNCNITYYPRYSTIEYDFKRMGI